MKDRKRVMGRGLGAILSAEARSLVNSVSDMGADKLLGSIVEVPLEDIYPNSNQPRTFFDEKSLEELAISIKSLGVIQPVTLRKNAEKFEIISGERRFRASKIAGLKTIPAYIRLVDDRQLLEMALVENIQREDLDDIEVALTYQRLLDELGMTQEALSKRIGKDRSSITNCIRLLKLSPLVQRAIRVGDISAGHGRAILSLDDVPLQELLYEKIIKKKLNVRQAEAAATLLKYPNEEKKQIVKQLPNNLKKIQKTIADTLDINVEIKSSAKGKKGKIIFDFSSHEDLDRILSFFEKN